MKLEVQIRLAGGVPKKKRGREKDACHKKEANKMK
jgi:hypothetical protein